MRRSSTRWWPSNSAHGLASVSTLPPLTFCGASSGEPDFRSASHPCHAVSVRDRRRPRHLKALSCPPILLVLSCLYHSPGSPAGQRHPNIARPSACRFCASEDDDECAKRRECAIALTGSLDDRDLDRSLRHAYNGLEESVRPIPTRTGWRLNSTAPAAPQCWPSRPPRSLFAPSLSSCESVHDISSSRSRDGTTTL